MCYPVRILRGTAEVHPSLVERPGATGFPVLFPAGACSIALTITLRVFLLTLPAIGKAGRVPAAVRESRQVAIHGRPLGRILSCPLDHRQSNADLQKPLPHGIENGRFFRGNLARGQVEWPEIVNRRRHVQA